MLGGWKTLLCICAETKFRHTHTVFFRKRARHRTKPHYLFIVLVTPLLGNNPAIRINRARHCCHGKFYCLSLEKDEQRDCGFHFEEPTPPNANKTLCSLWVNAKPSTDILKTTSLFVFVHFYMLKTNYQSSHIAFSPMCLLLICSDSFACLVNTCFV